MCSHQAYKPRKGKVDHSLAHFSEEQKSFILKLTRDVLCYFGYSKYLDLLRAPSPSPSPSVAPDLTQKNESGGKSESESEDPERKEKRRTEKEEIVAYILKNYQDSRIYLTPGLLHVNFVRPLIFNYFLFLISFIFNCFILFLLYLFYFYLANVKPSSRAGFAAAGGESDGSVRAWHELEEGGACAQARRPRAAHEQPTIKVASLMTKLMVCCGLLCTLETTVTR
jgi:hypothetical protein